MISSTIGWAWKRGQRVLEDRLAGDLDQLLGDVEADPGADPAGQEHRDPRGPGLAHELLRSLPAHGPARARSKRLSRRGLRASPRARGVRPCASRAARWRRCGCGRRRSTRRSSAVSSSRIASSSARVVALVVGGYADQPAVGVVGAGRQVEHPRRELELVPVGGGAVQRRVDEVARVGDLLGASPGRTAPSGSSRRPASSPTASRRAGRRTGRWRAAGRGCAARCRASSSSSRRRAWCCWSGCRRRSRASASPRRGGAASSRRGRRRRPRPRPPGGARRTTRAGGPSPRSASLSANCSSSQLTSGSSTSGRSATLSVSSQASGRPSSTTTSTEERRSLW